MRTPWCGHHRSHTREHLQIRARIHTWSAGISGQTEQVSRLQASIIERERSSRNERAREGDGEGWKSLCDGTTSALRRKINATTLRNLPKNLVFLFLRCWPPSLFYSLLFLENTPDHVNIVHDVKKSLKNRAVYVPPTNFHSDSVNPIYIVDRSSRNNRRDKKAPSQISILPTSWSIVVYRKKTRKKVRDAIPR